MFLPSEISFIVSPNDKGSNPKRPDYRGEVTILGKTYDLAAWKRKAAQSGREFVSGKLTLRQPKEEEQHEEPSQPTNQAPATQHDAKPDDDVPF